MPLEIAPSLRPDVRPDAGVLRGAAELFALAPAHSRDEIMLFEELFSQLFADASPEDRFAIARFLAGRADCPPLAALKLARDRIEVAEPVLARSAALSAVDLLAIAATRSDGHRRAIARRAELAPELVTALLRSGDAETLKLVLGRPGLVLPPTAVETLVAQLGKMPALAPLVAAQPTFPRILLFEPHAFMALPRPARQEVIAAIIDEIGPRPPRRPVPADVAPLAERLQSMAYAGALDGFAAELAAALKLDPPLATALIADSGGDGLAIALRALGLSPDAALRMLLHVSTDVGRIFAVMIEIAELLEMLDTAVAGALVDRWRGGPAQRRGLAPVLGTVVTDAERLRRAEPRLVELRRGEERPRVREGA